MRKTEKRFLRVDTTVEDQVKKYELLLNDPLVNILDQESVTEKLRIFSDEGKLQEVQEHVVYLVHYEKTIL